jgi:hypothetical protein
LALIKQESGFVFFFCILYFQRCSYGTALSCDESAVSGLMR